MIFTRRKKSPSTASEGEGHPVEAKYKTEICRKWESGSCPFKNRCLFAHGEHELRRKVLVAGYKTKQCKSFFTSGFCPYGKRCLFSHRLENSNSEARSKNVSEFIRNRLPVFVDLERRIFH